MLILFRLDAKMANMARSQAITKRLQAGRRCGARLGAGGVPGEEGAVAALDTLGDRGATP